MNLYDTGVDRIIYCPGPAEDNFGEAVHFIKVGGKVGGFRAAVVKSKRQVIVGLPV